LKELIRQRADVILASKIPREKWPPKRNKKTEREKGDLKLDILCRREPLSLDLELKSLRLQKEVTEMQMDLEIKMLTLEIERKKKKKMAAKR